MLAGEEGNWKEQTSTADYVLHAPDTQPSNAVFDLYLHDGLEPEATHDGCDLVSSCPAVQARDEERASSFERLPVDDVINPFHRQH